jgi:transposase
MLPIGNNYGILFIIFRRKLMRLEIGISNGKKYLSIVRAYRDKQRNKLKKKTVKSLGYLDKLKECFPDPIAHFREVAAQMTIEDAPISINIDRDKLLVVDGEGRKNFGYAALSKIYHELGLDLFFRNNSRKFKGNYNVSSIMKLLVYSRILRPASKKKTYEMKDMYFDKTDFSLDDIYRCLSFVNGLKSRIQRHIHDKVIAQYNRNCEVVYYDVTNYYFEIDKQDDLRRYGVSKEHRADPIVQLGLLMDPNGIPISYGLFSGNTNDCETLRPILSDLRRDFDIGRIIVVADKGLNTQNNIQINILNNSGYIYSQRIRGAAREFQDYILEETGYHYTGEGFKIKSRIMPRELNVTNIFNKKKSKISVEEKQVVFYSEKYARRSKAERVETLRKAYELVNDPAKYNRATSYGAAKYVKNIEYDSETGEIITAERRPVFDYEKLAEDEKFDGYYAIVTSEYKKDDSEIVALYKGLWKIEEAFKVTKSDLKTRPVYLSREDHIKAHFLICFIALVIVRILHYRLGSKYSVSSIVESLNKVACSPMEENLYLFDYTDNMVKDIGEKLNIDFTTTYLQLGEIKKILGNTKK